MPIRFRTILLFFIIGWYVCAGAAQLPEPIGIVIKGHKIPSGAYSLYAREVGSREPVLAVNAELPLNPASVIKIIPTLAALELLGPGYRWKTEVYTLGSIRDGVLQGDILFKGYGNPHLVTEEFRKILEELRRRGLREITGDLLIDHSYFNVPYENPGAFDNSRTVPITSCRTRFWLISRRFIFTSTLQRTAGTSRFIPNRYWPD